MRLRIPLFIAPGVAGRVPTEVNQVSALTTQADSSLARPLHVLVPLIRKDLEAGEEASRQACLPYYRAAGGKMLEAKGQLPHGEFVSWVERNFPVTYKHAQTYMKLAKATDDTEKGTPAQSFSSLDDFRRRHLGESRIPGSQRDKDWRDPVQQTLKKVDVETLNIRREELKRAEERDAQRKLALQLVDIGYKALASKLHPDKGGSREAMARLNQVRDRLKASA